MIFRQSASSSSIMLTYAEFAVGDSSSVCLPDGLDEVKKWKLMLAIVWFFPALSPHYFDL